MTTPAIDSFEQQTGVGTISYFDGNNNPAGSDHVNVIWRRREERRPRSVSNPKSASGWRHPSGWSHFYQYCTPSPITSSYRVQLPPGFGSTVYSDGAGFDGRIGDVLPTDSNDENLAIIKALNKLKNQKVNLAQAFAEREQTVKLFASTVKTIAKSVDIFRSKNPKRLWNLIKGTEGKRGAKVPNAWLELQYGWKPGMSDVLGACQELEDRNDPHAYSASVSGLVKHQDTHRWLKSSLVGSTFGIDVLGERFTLTKVRLDYVLENPLLQTLSSLGITNPAALAWELVPYSFVVDWFAPIGSWLSSMDAANAWSFNGGTRTVFQTLKETGIGWKGHWTDGFATIVPIGSPSYANNITRLSRETYRDSPLPGFPGLKNPMSSGHIANAMALLVTALSRK
ncbi:TPA_asm: maturation protein [ssRNA phage Esthiorhiza.3_8]|uniref:Maturation protein n=2 Tax=Fiersviridae TaxID=2842319 RepID=A0A8S5L3X6_9VIRU|nr:maturation protein [ssRNA phage Esthiorhiza.3_8]QDH91454.1 MAG: hypothetical protein H3RhizoLitter14667_000004 [Leviviridae sp.]DAD52029.1 TPA_asm: maturation protein [ssRNA phage Esthiorhiza.3_8]